MITTDTVRPILATWLNQYFGFTTWSSRLNYHRDPIQHKISKSWGWGVRLYILTGYNFNTWPLLLKYIPYPQSTFPGTTLIKFRNHNISMEKQIFICTEDRFTWWSRTPLTSKTLDVLQSSFHPVLINSINVDIVHIGVEYSWWRLLVLLEVKCILGRMLLQLLDKEDLAISVFFLVSKQQNQYFGG